MSEYQCVVSYCVGVYVKNVNFEWMKLYINKDVMEIQAILILRSQGVKGEKCFADETTPFLLYSLE